MIESPPVPDATIMFAGETDLAGGMTTLAKAPSLKVFQRIFLLLIAWMSKVASGFDRRQLPRLEARIPICRLLVQRLVESECEADPGTAKLEGNDILHSGHVLRIEMLDLGGR
jgi:hypothetical protein